jgi:hypothetical protein
MRPAIVVLTPVRNEAWILDRFLSVTSQFADVILVADQGSTDGSRSIYPKFPKVVVIDNSQEAYDEASRQAMLIDAARQRVTGPRILLALDADEIVAANGISRPGWQDAINAAPGTVLCFEKPDLLCPPDRCIRYDQAWPIGYVDDGAPHQPKKIHSIRIPVPPDAPKMDISEVKILHYCHTRPDAQRAKVRMYAVLEAILNTSPVRRRRVFYSAHRNWTANHRVETTDSDWFAGWEAMGIDMRSTVTSRYYWQDYEVLRLFAKHGTRRFWLDDIWDEDWESCRQHALSLRMAGIPSERIKPPPPGVGVITSLIDGAQNILSRARHNFGKRA